VPGGRQTASPDHHVKRGSGRQTPVPRRPVYARSLFGTAACASAAIPLAAVGTTLHGWLAGLAVMLLAVGGVVVGVIAAVMPQESKDRLSWWREWLRHRERVLAGRPSVPPTRPGRTRRTRQARQPRSARMTGEAEQPLTSPRDLETLIAETGPDADALDAPATSATDALVPE
jgi:hypothetical protein